MFDINEVNDFIASNCLTHGRCPKNGLRGYELHEIDEHCDSWRVGVYESIEAAFASMARHI